MELERPKFMDTEWYYYDNDGLKVKEDSPEWVKKEYNKFMKNLKSNVIVKQ
jgi:hypothetical protein